MEATILKLDGLSKSFGPTKAVQQVSMQLHAGEVMGLIGENGSGKSTLMAMVTGTLAPDSGSMEFKNAPYAPKTLIDASNRGICILIQELGTIAGLTVAENIFLGKENRFSRFGAISARKMNAEAQAMLDLVGASGIRAAEPVESYSFEERKLVEICKAMCCEPEILVVDETTTALSHTGREKIYAIIQALKEAGKAVVFISHDLEEVQRVCDTATVLRDGEYVGRLVGDEVTPDNMRRLMIGRDLEGNYYRDATASYATERVVLKAEGIQLGKVLKGVSLELHEGEILGLGGLTECGMHELCKVIFGGLKPDGGTVTLTEAGVQITGTEQAIQNHMAYLPKDRDQESLFLLTSIKDNIAVTSLDNLRKGPFITPKSEQALAGRAAAELSVKMQNVNQLVKELSGGNKQKVVVAKWLANGSQILLMDCPTRGIDIGVKMAIYSLMEELVRQGRSIIMVSEEIPELLGMSDRILIMKDGCINGQFTREDEVTEHMLIEKVI